MKVVSCRPAWMRTSNRFTTLFSQAVQQAGWDVREFGWTWSGLFAPKVILLHWPDELFTAEHWFQHAKALIKLVLLRAAKVISRSKLVWMVHETRPHDVGRKAKWSTRAFLSSLDGAIYLSRASRTVSIGDIPELGRIPSLVTRHGHYREDLEIAPHPRREPGRRLELVYFGQIRAYKNLDGLIRAARDFSPDDLRVKIIGWSKDPDFTRQLEQLAADSPAVALDIRDQLVPQIDLERAIAESDGVVLPYRNILNSGAALLALSCNRPVLAPRLGSLPELQEEIGADWVRLYDGDISSETLRSFCASLRASRRDTADLSLYEWDAIGDSIAQFLDQLTIAKPAKRRDEIKREVESTWR